MSFKRKNTEKVGYPKVTNIEVSEKHVKLRTFLVIALLAIGCVAIMTGLFSMLNKEPGWQVVEVSTSAPNCSSDFQLHYDFSNDGGGATAAYKKLSALYTEAAENAYRVFSKDVSEEDLCNLAYLNQHVNEIVTVDPALHSALDQIADSGNRSVFLVPVYVEYERIFISENEAEAAQYDPAQNPELVEYIQQAAAFAHDPSMISLEIMEENQLRLNVSDAYLAFAEWNEITEFVDLSWMKNAFIIDYLAQVLSDNGFTNGYLASYDGFTRNLDERGNVYSFNVFDRLDNGVNLPAVMSYDEPSAIVFLRNYPLNEADKWHYFSFPDGSIATMMIDSKDGMSKSSTDNLVCYSHETGCAQMLLQMIPAFISDSLDDSILETMASGRIYSIWAEGQNIYCNDPEMPVSMVEDASGVEYQLRPAA